MNYELKKKGRLAGQPPIKFYHEDIEKIGRVLSIESKSMSLVQHKFRETYIIRTMTFLRKLMTKQHLKFTAIFVQCTIFLETRILKLSCLI